MIKDQHLHWWGPAVEEHPESSDAIIHVQRQPEACAKQNMTIHEPSLSLCMCLWTYIVLLTCSHVMRAFSTYDLEKAHAQLHVRNNIAVSCLHTNPFPPVTLQAISSHQCDYSLLAFHNRGDAVVRDRVPSQKHKLWGWKVQNCGTWCVCCGFCQQWKGGTSGQGYSKEKFVAQVAKIRLSVQCLKQAYS